MNAPIPNLFSFDNTYCRELEGCFVAWQPAQVPAPKLVYLNRPLALELGLPLTGLAEDEAAALFSGNRPAPGAQPIAQAYAGHQFGNFSPRLGDGRALLLGEVIDRQGLRRDIALKGSGRTPFSRGGDGKAALGPMLREVLMGEAMHALGIPTTRALAVTTTGEPVFREELLPGAVLTRVAASHLRVGTFQFFAAQGDHDRVRTLADYALRRHDPSLAALDGSGRYVGLLRSVSHRQARLVAQWMSAGFIHGVMNTDNMTLSGETIDYGPCAFLEAYDPATVFSSIDHGGRYAYGNQPRIAQWNLARFAEALLPLLAQDTEEAVASATDILEEFPLVYQRHWLILQRRKLGLADPTCAPSDPYDAAAPLPATLEADVHLAQDWLGLLHDAKADYTCAWRALAEAAGGNNAPVQALMESSAGSHAARLEQWLERWRERLAREDSENRTPGMERAEADHARAARMRQINPRIIARNHRVEEALDAAWRTGDLSLFERLLAALARPFDDDPALEDFAQPAPVYVTACYRTFCGT